MDTAHKNILVIGGGPAGTFAAMAAKKQDPAARVVLLSDEACEPYEKPPLSKAVLLGKVRPSDALIAGPHGLVSHGIPLEGCAKCAAIDLENRAVSLTDGRRLPYDSLVIATGSQAREIPQLPLGTPGVHYLRTEADAHALKSALERSSRLLVVGGGLIGLEVAASAAELGVRTTVIEVAPRILARVCDEETSRFVHDAHATHGVDIRVGTSIRHASADSEGKVTVVTDDGTTLTGDLAVIGTGARPDDRLAADAGIAVQDGIIVDEYCRTSDPAVYAAGDVVRFPGPHGPVRLENWRHAQDQGAVAGRNAAGASDRYTTVPSFWSEQYDLYIQGVGWTTNGTMVRRPLSGNAALLFVVNDQRLVYAMGINVQRDIAAARRLIERGSAVDPAALADPSAPLAAMLKARP